VVIGDVAVPRGLVSLRRGALLAAALLAATVSLLAFASRSHAQSCKDGATADICVNLGSVGTSATGVYTLNIPAHYIGSQPYLYPSLKECRWDVSADFGDGSPPWVGTFDTEVGIKETHKYPSYGVYHATIDATNGKKPNEAPCESVHIEVTVTWSEPAPPPPPPPPPPPTEETTGGGGPAGGGSGGGATGEEEKREPGQALIVYWSECGRGIYVHRVGCRKAGTVVGKARPRLLRGLHSVRVAGFSCTFRQKALRRISCRRGSRRILAP
jgi:hypothetical protein